MCSSYMTIHAMADEYSRIFMKYNVQLACGYLCNFCKLDANELIVVLFGLLCVLMCHYLKTCHALILSWKFILSPLLLAWFNIVLTIFLFLLMMLRPSRCWMKFFHCISWKNIFIKFALLLFPVWVRSGKSSFIVESTNTKEKPQKKFFFFIFSLFSRSFN